MGCCSEKMNSVKNKYHQLAMSEEETIITMREKSLPFSTIKLSDLELLLNKQEHNQVFSINQIRHVMAELNVDVEIFSTPDQHIHTLLKLLQNPKRLYDYKTVMLFGVVLSSGTTKEKGEVLFKLYDAKKTGTISEGELVEMIEDLIDVSVNKIPRVAVDENEHRQVFTMSRMKLEEYVGMLMTRKQALVSRALNALIGGKKSVTRSEFVKRMEENSLLESLLWSFQLRLTMLDV
jgi:Ca2+-binding EF-hand superfamily protein